MSQVIIRQWAQPTQLESFLPRKNNDVFLISLKAEGTRLNLTAADYAICKDLWWNPAVEDQASDRAHRIRQQLAVTIYRLATQDALKKLSLCINKKES